MRKIFAALLFTLVFTAPAYAETLAAPSFYEVCFTPGQNCTRLIVKQIERAQKSIYMQAYTLTSRGIVAALIAAHDRKVDVEVLIDQSNFKPGNRSLISKLIASGIPVWNDNTVDIAHNKVMIFDETTLETGSFNYTYAAQKYNAENVLIINNPTLAQEYLANWKKRQAVSKVVSVGRFK